MCDEVMFASICEFDIGAGEEAKRNRRIETSSPSLESHTGRGRAHVGRFTAAE